MAGAACALIVIGAVLGMAFESWRASRASRRFIIGTRDALSKVSARR